MTDLAHWQVSPFHQFSNSSFNHDFYDRYLSHDSHQPLQTPLIGIERTQDLLSLKLPPHGPEEPQDTQRAFSKEWNFDDNNKSFSDLSNKLKSSTSQNGTNNNNNSSNNNNSDNNGANSGNNNNSSNHSPGNPPSNTAGVAGPNTISASSTPTSISSASSSPIAIEKTSSKRTESPNYQDDGGLKSKRSNHAEVRKGFPFNYKSNSSSGDSDDNQSSYGKSSSSSSGHGPSSPYLEREGSYDSRDKNNSLYKESMRHFNPERIRQNASYDHNHHHHHHAPGSKQSSPIHDQQDDDNQHGDHHIAHQYHGQESMFGLDPSKHKFRYMLAAPISIATKLNEDSMTYLNQSQAYEIKLENLTDVAEAKRGFMCSIINIGFHERHMQQVENELWQQWSQQHPNEKIFSVDMKLSYNVFGVESDGLNKYEFLWDSSKAAGVFIRINSISTEFTVKKHGGEKGVPFKLAIETFSYNSKTHESYFISAACCQMKVFKPKGAERKLRSDRDKVFKKSASEQEKYHKACDHSLFRECSLNSLHPMVDGSDYYRHSHGHFASKQFVTSSGSQNTTHQQPQQQQQHQQHSEAVLQSEDEADMANGNSDERNTSPANPPNSQALISLATIDYHCSCNLNHANQNDYLGPNQMTHAGTGENLGEAMIAHNHWNNHHHQHQSPHQTSPGSGLMGPSPNHLHHEPRIMENEQHGTHHNHQNMNYECNSSSHHGSDNCNSPRKDDLHSRNQPNSYDSNRFKPSYMMPFIAQPHHQMQQGNQYDNEATSNAMTPYVGGNDVQTNRIIFIIKLTQRILDAIDTGEFGRYKRLCAPSITAFEPESLGNLIEGTDFHQVFFDRQSSASGTRHSKILNPSVLILSEDSASIAYVRLTITRDINGVHTQQFEETRIWLRKDHRWMCVHFHRSKKIQ